MKKIVVADAEVKIAQFLQRALELDGHAVRTAQTTEAAWALIVSDPPDLLITDCKLPPSDGIALMRQAHAQFPDMPVVMITGFDETETAAQAREAGAKGFFGKPLNVAEVCAKVLELLGTSQALGGENPIHPNML